MRLCSVVFNIRQCIFTTAKERVASEIPSALSSLLFTLERKISCTKFRHKELEASREKGQFTLSIKSALVRLRLPRRYCLTAYSILSTYRVIICIKLHWQKVVAALEVLADNEKWAYDAPAMRPHVSPHSICFITPKSLLPDNFWTPRRGW